jgi:hypothetical protein
LPGGGGVSAYIYYIPSILYCVIWNEFNSSDLLFNFLYDFHAAIIIADVLAGESFRLNPVDVGM